MPARPRTQELSTATLATTLSQMRARAGLTQAEVAARMKTTQTAIARLESGRQSPTMQTLHSFARANGFCLEIGFVRSVEEDTGCIMIVDNSRPRQDEAAESLV